MAKQTLYEVLGVAQDASPHDIRHATDTRRKFLNDEYLGDDRQNQLAFLNHASEVLLDERRRAAYDAQTRDTGAVLPEEETSASLGKRHLLLAGLVIFAGGLWLGRQSPNRVDKPTGDQAVSIAAAPAPASTPATGALENIAAEEIESPMPAPLPATPTQSKAAVRSSGPVVVVVNGNPLMTQILQSTYAIVGRRGFGTGVAIESDRLLTNCHVIAPNVLQGKIYAVSPVSGARFEITEAAFLVKEDACVVHVPGLAGKPIPLGDTQRLTRGARFHNIGFANGKLTLAEGQYLGNIVRSGQTYMVSTNYCAAGVSGGPLVNDEGQLMGLTSGGTADTRYCASLTAETARSVLDERMMLIDAFPTNYTSNFNRPR